MILVLDTATRTPAVALARSDGALVGQRQWLSHHRHGEELLQRVDELLAEAGVARRDLSGVVVGTGPGSFTGLRIGLATAKTVAYSLDIPIVGVSSTLALAAATTDDGEVSVTLPAGASDRYVHRVRVVGGEPVEMAAPELVAGMTVSATGVAVDIDSAPEGALTAGENAVKGLAAAMARLGARRLADGQADDVAAIVPAYVALPRGIARATVEMAWSPDLR
ncbi:MAG TPA: tRNA (adenosine(37)-N6)-threonylcarbamoyltransferase complex dimerization subunit type 1 TsaB [Candidatus Limnocylindrales bacterium]